MTFKPLLFPFSSLSGSFIHFRSDTLSLKKKRIFIAGQHHNREISRLLYLSDEVTYGLNSNSQPGTCLQGSKKVRVQPCATQRSVAQILWPDCLRVKAGLPGVWWFFLANVS